MIKTAINNWTVHCRTHGEQEHSQINLLDILLPVDFLPDASQNEVEMIREPANGKCYHNCNHCPDKLGPKKKKDCLMTVSLFLSPLYNLTTSRKGTKYSA